MSRQRQALGLLTNKTNQYQKQQQQQQQITKQVIHKDVVSSAITSNAFIYQQSSSTTTAFKTVPIQTQINDENELQQQLKQQTKSFDFDIFNDNNKENQQQQQSDDFDFQIFCEKQTNNNNNKIDNKKDEPLKELNILDSPMILDDTIKFQLSKSEDEIQQQFDDEESIEVDDEIDEEKVRKLKLIEQENILMSCEEYEQDILKHLRELEMVNRPKQNYIKQQQDITSSMRSILVDWLVEVCEEYKLHTETLYLAVNYTDRFLSKMSVLRGKLQLLGTASIYIASKYEEIFPPDINDFVYITDDTYTKQQVLRMEHLILKVLNFHMNAPTANCFLLHYLRYFNADKKTEHLARYIAELTLVEAEPFLEYLPSQIAACALYLSLFTLNKLNSFNENLVKLTGYEYNEIRKCLNDVYKCMCAARDHAQQAIQDKYKQERYDSVALIQPPTSFQV